MWREQVVPMSSLTDDMKLSFAEGDYRDRLTSTSAHWGSLFVRVKEAAPYGDPLESPAFANPAVCLFIGSMLRMDHFSGGRWRGIDYTHGTGVITPAGQSRRLRFDSKGQSFAMLFMLLAQDTVDLVAAEMQRPGSAARQSVPDVRFVNDPAISSFALSTVSALQAGAPSFYAEVSAQWLAAHLLLGPSNGAEWLRSLSTGQISDARLLRVLEYIQAHLADRLDLRVLSREAGISPFHFAALFRKAIGATPHKHVQYLRMQTAQYMLRDTDKSILDIALTCGFGSASHFAAAFRQQFSKSPTEYRSAHDRFRLLPKTVGTGATEEE